MKTCTKFLAGAVALIALGMGAISCSTEPEIKEVEKNCIFFSNSGNRKL